MKFLFLVALAAALPAMGQQNMPRGPFAWWDSPVVKDLNLSKDQLQKVQSTVHDSRSKLIDLRAAVQKAELDVEDAFNAETFDVRRATDAVDRLASARAETGKALALLSVNLRSVLTADQWKELQKRRPGHMRGMGRGMGQGNMRPDGPMGRGGMRPGGGMNRDRGSAPQPPPPSNN